MPRRKPTVNGSPHLRRSIASAAARLMAEEGVTDYGLAKRKAASRLGARSTESLPTNEEIEEELRTYQALYQDEEQPEVLHELRQTALELMELFDVFQPRLRGAVFDGTASAHSAIHLMLYADSSKDVEIWLLSRSIAYEPTPLRNRRPQEPEARLSLDWDGIPVMLEVFPAIQIRNGLLPPSANRAALEALMGGARHG